MNIVEQLIEDVEKNTKSLDEQVANYHATVTKLVNHYDLKMTYHIDSFNGRKICFGSHCSETIQEAMIVDLILSNRIEDFIKYLVDKILPSYKYNFRNADYHF